MTNLEEKKNDPKFMKDYLKHALEFEKRVFMWECALEQSENQGIILREEQQDLLQEKANTQSELAGVEDEMKKQKRKTEMDIYSYHRNKVLKKRFFIFSAAFFVLMTLIAIITKVYPLIAVAIFPPFFYFVLKIYFAVVGSFFRGLLGLGDPETKEDKAKRIEMYEDSLKNNIFEEATVRRKKTLGDEIDKLSVAIYYKNMEISRGNLNREDIKSSLKEARNTLSEIYSLNVLPLKYRCFVAVAQLYEYLENGVGTIVQGHGGIYSMYEHHLEIGMILSKLDVVIARLEEIAENQSMLHDSIMESNRLLSRIDEDIKSGNQAFAEYASASLAYQSQQAAALQWQNWSTSY